MNKDEKLKQELNRILNEAPPGRRKQIEESIEYKIAIKQGDIQGAYQFVWAKVFGEGRTKKDAEASAGAIKILDYLELS